MLAGKEWREKPHGMLFQSGTRVCEEVEMASAKLKAMSQDCSNILLNKRMTINLARPSVCKTSPVQIIKGLTNGTNDLTRPRSAHVEGDVDSLSQRTDAQLCLFAQEMVLPSDKKLE